MEILLVWHKFQHGASSYTAENKQTKLIWLPCHLRNFNDSNPMNSSTCSDLKLTQNTHMRYYNHTTYRAPTSCVTRTDEVFPCRIYIIFSYTLKAYNELHQHLASCLQTTLSLAVRQLASCNLNCQMRTTTLFVDARYNICKSFSVVFCAGKMS